MTAIEQSVLVAASDPSHAERLLPALRRSNLSVRRALGASRAAEAVRRERFDLVVVALPLAEAAEVLAAARQPGSVCERSALLAVVDRPAGGPIKERLPANRVLAADCTPEELEATVTSLLTVAPRAEIHAPIKVRQGLDEPYSVSRVSNLSTSGMFVLGVDDLPRGSVFGFELTLPGEEQAILGRAQVVRRAAQGGVAASGFGASFLALGGEGADRVRAVVDRRISEAEPVGGGAAVARAARGAATASVGQREELEELTPVLDGLLSRGLYRRFEVADWYVTGAELGLESLHAFYCILEQIYSATGPGSGKERSLADLRVVHQALGELAKPQQTVGDRVRIMLEIRRPLERLLIELAETRRLSKGGAGDHPHKGMVSRVVADVGRELAIRRGLESFRRALIEALRPRHIFARRAGRRLVEELLRQYGGYGAALGFGGPDILRSRRGRRAVLSSVVREIGRIDAHLKAIQDVVYQGRFLPRASGGLREDLARESLLAVLAEILVEGYEYLVRAYSAYRHALEAVGADPGLLERSARLASAVEAVTDRRPDAAAQDPQPRPGGDREARPTPARSPAEQRTIPASPDSRQRAAGL